MKVLLFNQFPQLVARFRAIAKDAATDAAEWPICRVEATAGAAHLRDRAMNVLAISGGETRLVMPDIIPGRARRFCLRITAEGTNSLVFTGAEAVEASDASALAPPSDGETAIYDFSETVGDRLFVERRVVGYAV